MKRVIVLLSVATALTACGDVMTSPTAVREQVVEFETTTQTPLDAIQVVSAGTINAGKFAAVGEIKTSVGKATALGKTPSLEDGQQKLRIEAAKLGADAVINAKVSDVTICPLSWGCRNISGTAVKFVQ